MTLELVREILGWCTLINLGVLLWWFGFLVFAHDWVYNMHARLFTLSEERFDAFHYQAMGYYKLTVFIFNLAPWLALHFAT